MSGRVRGGQRPARNWLESLDDHASRLPIAVSWLEPYGLFMLARYPHLRPQPLPGDVHSQIMCESGERTAARLIEEWDARIAENTGTSVCITDLNGEQRKQLAALLLDIVSELEIRVATDRTARWASQLRKEAERRIRMLNRKLERARKAIEELRTYAQDSDTGSTREDALHTSRTMLGFPYLNATSKALDALNTKHFPNAHEQIELVKDHVISEGIETFGMVRLYWFFHHGCGTTGDDAEVRTALLRNTFWTKYGCEAVQVRLNYDGAESRGSDAVHIAVSRFRF